MSSCAGALDLASGLGGKIDKSDVLSAVEKKYEKYHVCYGGDEERKANYADMYGWGESFHFAPRWKGEFLQESIKRDEHFIALQLGLKPGQKVFDVGCGIGGLLREIVRFSHSSVTGLNNNEYQITRGKVMVLEKVGIVPKGSQRVQSFLEKAAEGLVAVGKKEIFTAMYFFVTQKPIQE